jgi:hypothetical protein
MKNYRLVESAPKDGTRHGTRKRTQIFAGPDKRAFKQAIATYYEQPHKPYAEVFYYYGRDRIYAYEI